MKTILRQLRLGRPLVVGEFTIHWTEDSFAFRQECTGLCRQFRGRCTAANLLRILRLTEEVPPLSDRDWARAERIRQPHLYSAECFAAALNHPPR